MANVPFPSPFEFFSRWFQLARDARVPQYDAMILATATKDAKPSARVVLLKGVIQGTFRFHTNYESRKSLEMDENPQAQLLFYWPQFGHQIRVEGVVRKQSAADSDEYFLSRSRESRIGAIASRQSRPLASMDALVADVARVEKEYEGKEVARPANWGGWELVPARFEFWEDGEHRLHERIVYEKDASGAWRTSRLYP